MLFILVWAACKHGICGSGFCGLWAVVICSRLSIYVLEVWLFTRRPVNVCDTIYRSLCYWLCWWFCDWNGFWVVWADLLAADWRCLMMIVRKCCFDKWDLMEFVMSYLWNIGIFKLSSRVSACLQLLLQAACKRFCRVFKINCN